MPKSTNSPVEPSATPRASRRSTRMPSDTNRRQSRAVNTSGFFAFFGRENAASTRQSSAKNPYAYARMTCGNSAAADRTDKGKKRRDHARFICPHPSRHPCGVGIELEHVQKIPCFEIQICGKRAKRERMQRVGESRDRVHGKTSVKVQRRSRARGGKAPGRRQRRSGCRRGRRQVLRRESRAPSAWRRQAASRRRRRPRRAGSAR